MLLFFFISLLGVSSQSCPPSSQSHIVPAIDQSQVLQTQGYYSLTQPEWQQFTAGNNNRLYSIDLVFDQPGVLVTLTLFSDVTMTTIADTSRAYTGAPGEYTSFVFKTLPPLTGTNVYVFLINASTTIGAAYSSNVNSYLGGNASITGDFKFRTTTTTYSAAHFECLVPSGTATYTFNPPFPSPTSGYILEFDRNVPSVQLRYAATLGSEIITLNTAPFQPTGFNNITIGGTGSTNTIVVQSTDGLVTTLYTIFVTQRQLSGVAMLQSLEFDYEVDITSTPTFEPTQFGYLYNIPACMARYESQNFVCSLMIHATSAFRGNVTSSVPLNTPLTFALADIGVNRVITITVTSENTLSTNVYTLQFVFQPGTYSYLNDISFTNGELTAEYSEFINIYQANFNHTQTVAYLVLNPLAGTTITVNQAPYIPEMDITLAAEFCTRETINITVQPEDSTLPPSEYEVQIVKLAPPAPPGPNNGLPDKIKLDIVQIYFATSNDETFVLDMRLQIALALEIPESTQIVVIDVNIPTGGGMSARFGFYAPQCGALDYGTNWVQEFQTEWNSGATHGDLAAMPNITEIAEANYYYGVTVDICVVGGQVNWGATCIQLQDSSIETHGNGLAYEEAVSVVVAIGILILIILFFGDLTYRKIHKQQKEHQGTELSNRGGSGRGNRKEKSESGGGGRGDSSPQIESKEINSPSVDGRPAADSEVVDVA